MFNLSQIEGFEWDDANREKNWLKHEVTWEECEEVFTNNPLEFFYDLKHSEKEDRFSALCLTNKTRLLSIVFTIRNNYIRIISARAMNKEERKTYEQIKKSICPSESEGAI